MKIKVIEDVSYASASYIIDSTILYNEVMKTLNNDIENKQIFFVKDDKKVEPPKITENDIIAIYMERNGAEWLEYYDVYYISGYWESANDYLYDLCQEEVWQAALGNRVLEDWGEVQNTRKEAVYAD